MWKRSSILCGLAVLAMTMSSCILDPKPGNPVKPKPPVVYYDLTEKEHPLYNLELAYNDRNITQYRRLLDENFTFFLSDGDIGLGIPGNQWDRSDEETQTGRLFSTNPPEPYPRCISIQMDVQTELGIQWFDVHQEDETWYSTTIFYDFIIQIAPDMTYLAVPGAKAQFTVRNAGTEEAPLWKLIEWRDLGAAAN